MRTVVPALKDASATMLAVLATLACVLALAPAPGIAVLATVLCVSFARTGLERDLRGRIEAALALPAIALAAMGAGFLLGRAPWLGACAFVAAITASIWLRRFGAVARRLGSLIALPFVALLVTPRDALVAAGPIPAPMLPVLAGLLALFWVSVTHMAGQAAGLLPRADPPAPEPEPAPAASGLRPPASTRMALQMAAALALSFAIGFTWFGTRWSWIVLTAFIVASGNRGRLDVIYKGALRVVGAAAGTLAALALHRYVDGHGATAAALILGALFVALWLRPFSYAWWALGITIAFALLQGFGPAPVAELLWARLEEIVIGALIAVATAWFVLPVRSSAALRRRLADALAALADLFDPDYADRSPGRFTAAVAAVEEMAPAFRAARAVMRRLHAPQPADWIDLLLACRTPALALAADGAAPGGVRRALGAARKALRETDRIAPALADLREALRAARA